MDRSQSPAKLAEDSQKARGGVALLARGLPHDVREEDLRTAFSLFGGVVAVKHLPKRHIAFVEFVSHQVLRDALESGPNFKLCGGTCFIEVANGTVGASVDMRQAGRHVCAVCSREFTSRAKLRAHESDLSAHSVEKPADEWDSMECLNNFNLEPQAMAADLGDGHRSLLGSYLKKAMPGSPEIAAIIDDVIRTQPVAIRTKELFESLESTKVLGQYIHELRAQGAVSEVYDLACGHGLVGALLAYRFPDLKVVCVDLEERPVWAQIRTSWQRVGIASRHSDTPLHNLSFVCGPISGVSLGPRSVALSIHACNEANQEVLEMSRAVKARFGVMPCCIPERLYSEGGLSVTHLPDASRYALMSGAIASQYSAARVTSIDGRITNRNIMIMGGGGQ